MLRYFVFCLLLLTTFTISAQDNADYYVASIGFYNLENLFDTNDDENVKDEEFTPNGERAWNTETYNQKLTDLSTVIADLAEETPDGLAILGVSEIENLSVLQDLVAQPKLSNRNYQIIHYDSPDKRGIDVALLYNPDYFTPTSSKSIPVNLGSDRPTRDVLLVSGEFDGEKMHFIVNHWPSRRGGENVSGEKRVKSAQLCKGIIDSLTAINPNEKIVVMGDLNDGPKNESVKNQLGAKGKKQDVRKGDLYNPMFMYYMTGVGSLAHRDSWNIFDQIILSSGLVHGKPAGYKYYKTKIENKSQLVQKLGRYRGYPKRTFAGNNYQGGFSDHFPVYVYIVKPVK